MSSNLDVFRMNAAKAFALDMLMAGTWTLPKTLPMNTNDEQAPYGPTVEQAADRLARALKDMDKPTERAPMLTRYSLYLDAPDTFVDMEHGEYVRWEDVHAKITSGELRVNKKATVIDGTTGIGWANHETLDTESCSLCMFTWAVPQTPYEANFCPGCGAEIVKG